MCRIVVPLSLTDLDATTKIFFCLNIVASDNLSVRFIITISQAFGDRHFTDREMSNSDANGGAHSFIAGFVEHCRGAFHAF
jgi:hypothetical protein